MLINRLKSLALILCTALSPGPFAAHAAGTIPLAMAQQIDINGQPLAGCIVNFFVAGTVATPQNSFSDFGLSQNPLPQLSCDQTGRIPMFWLADGLIHVRLTDSTGLQIIDTTMQVLGPSSGGGGGGTTVDPTAILSTGDEKTRYGIGALSGFVRENGLTMGNATSGATERANADTQALFIYLWNTDPNLAVSGGRGGNALADYNANKTIALPDMRGAVNGFLADMGNSATSVLTATYCGTLPTVLGAFCGSQNYTMLTANLPPYTPVVTPSAGGNTPIVVPAGSGAQSVTTTGGTTIYQTGSYVPLTNVGTPQGGTSTPFPTLPPMRLKTIYMKL